MRKKLTVIGMIGQMHGMTSASRPPSSPIRKMYMSEWLAMSPVPPKACSSLMTGCHNCLASMSAGAGVRAVLSAFAMLSVGVVVAASAVVASGVPGSAVAATSAFVASFLAGASTAGDFPCCLKATSLGGKQFSSLHAPYSKYTSMVYWGAVNFIFCTKVALPSK